jgi:glycerophosphoryl diester phosphodiesterase
VAFRSGRYSPPFQIADSGNLINMTYRIVSAFALLLLASRIIHAQADPAPPPSRLHAIDAKDPQGLQQLFRYDGQSLPLVSAHRGGADRGFPENCLETFENTLRQCYAILEVDPRHAKDGAIVLHHDATLERTTTGSGRVADHTLPELKELRLKNLAGRATEFQIPTLDEALEWARGKTVLVLDHKDVPLAARVKQIEEHRAERYAMLIVYSFDAARECHALNKNIMMEVMIPDREKLREFEKTGVPWSNVVAFVGHTPPQDVELLRLLHAKGVCCLAGTSRNLDLALAANRQQPTAPLEQQYRDLLSKGVDLLETDLPGDVARLLYREAAIPAAKSKFFPAP